MTASDSVLLIGVVASLVAGLSTGIGALPILFLRRITHNTQGVMLGFGAGVMLAATAFSLILPGLEAAVGDVGSNTFAAMIVSTAVLMGGVFLWLSNRYP